MFIYLMEICRASSGVRQSHRIPPRKKTVGDQRVNKLLSHASPASDAAPGNAAGNQMSSPSRKRKDRSGSRAQGWGQGSGRLRRAEQWIRPTRTAQCVWASRNADPRCSRGLGSRTSYAGTSPCVGGGLRGGVRIACPATQATRTPWIAIA